MFTLDKSDKAIQGLAKLIIQEPRTIPELKIIRDAFEKNGILTEKTKNPKYIKEQLEIIKKAEELANSDIWYGFILNDSYKGTHTGFMVYQRIGNEMIPLQEDFENGYRSELQTQEDLINFLESQKITHITTYSPHDFWTLFSQMYTIEKGEDENTPFDYEHKHMEFDDYLIKDLEKENIKITQFNEEQVIKFEKDLKTVVVPDVIE